MNTPPLRVSTSCSALAGLVRGSYRIHVTIVNGSLYIQAAMQCGIIIPNKQSLECALGEYNLLCGGTSKQKLYTAKMFTKTESLTCPILAHPPVCSSHPAQLTTVHCIE